MARVNCQSTLGRPRSRILRNFTTVGPADRLPDAFAEVPGDRIAGTAGGAVIDRRTAPALILCHMRGHGFVAQFY